MSLSEEVSPVTSANAKADHIVRKLCITPLGSPVLPDVLLVGHRPARRDAVALGSDGPVGPPHFGPPDAGPVKVSGKDASWINCGSMYKIAGAPGSWETARESQIFRKRVRGLAMGLETPQSSPGPFQR